jgi:hypothetical protein
LNRLQSWNTSYPILACVWIHPLLPIEYLLPSKLGENRYPQLVKVLASRLSKLKKLHENKLNAQDLVVPNQWNMSLWSHNWFTEIKFQFKNYMLWYLGVVFKHVLKFLR